MKLSFTSRHMGFQSTPPRGERPTATSRRCRISCYFNPRPREGSDGDICDRAQARLHFNPRPREGSDSKTIQKFSVKNIILHSFA